MATSPETGAAAETVFPPFDPTFFASQVFWLAITFGAMYFILSRVVLPRIGGTIERREDKILQDLDEAARLNDGAAEAVKAYEVSLAEARAKARDTAGQARAAVDAEIAAETEKVEAALEDKLSSAAERIAELEAQAMASVQSVAADAAAEVVAKLTGATVSEDEAGNAVKTALKGA
ncbi:MAG: F0F1 ATP synthase subunit B [Pseudomonadota bacterium]